MSAIAPTDAAGLGELLGSLGGLLDALGQVAEPQAIALAEIATRLAEGRFQLAVLGQVKRGKSTLLNALLGEAVLPTAVVPLTAIPTFLRAGAERSVRVEFADGREAVVFESPEAEDVEAHLARYVTEEANPHNREGVARVEVFHPAPLLARGVVLIDTPGTGSTFRHNTRTTLDFLPQCDAALFVTSVDPPLTETELDLLAEADERIPRLFFVLNKVDYLDGAEREQALGFLRRQLREHLPSGRGEPTIHCVSAKRGFEARRADRDDLWRESGMAEVEEQLVAFLADEKLETLQKAVARRGRDLAGDLLLRLRLELRAFELPLADLEARLATFETHRLQAERDRLVARDLLGGDRKRLLAALEERAAVLREEARLHLRGVVDAALGPSTAGPHSESEARAALDEAIPAHFRRSLRALAGEFDGRVREILEIHRRRAGDLVGGLRRAAAGLFEIPYQPTELALGIEVRREPYWITQVWSSFVKPIPPAFVDRLVSAARRERRVRGRFDEQIEDIVLRNVGRLRRGVQDQVEETLDRFARTLERQLDQAIAATHGALAATAERRRTESGAAERSRRRLAPHIERIEELRVALAALAAD